MGRRSGYLLDDWLVDPQMSTLSREEAQVRLELRVMQVLLCLIHHANTLVSREMLIQEVWHGGIITDNAINRIIGLLRQHLQDNPREPRFIKTVPKQGYVLIAKVRETTLDDDSQDEPLPAKLADAETDQKIAAGGSKWGYLGGAFGVLAAGIASWLYLAPAQENPQLELTDVAIRRLTPLTSLNGQEVDPSLSPDGSMLAFSYRELNADKWHIELMALGDRVIKTIPVVDDYSLRYPAWRHDGKALAYLAFSETQGCRIMVTELTEEGMRSRIVSQCHQTTQSTSIAWSPSNRSLFYVDAEGVEGFKRVFLLSLSDGRRQQLSQPHVVGRGDYALALSPDGHSLAVLRSINWFDTQILLFDIESGDWQNLQRVGYPLRSIAWDKGGNALVYRGEEGQLHRLQLKPRKLTRLTSVLQEINSPSANSAGRMAAVVGELFEEEIWFWSSPFDEASKPQRFVASSRRDTAGTLRHDGKELIFVSNRSGLPQLWRRDEQGTEKQLSRLSTFSHIDELSYSADDKLVAGSLNQQVFVLNPENGDLKFFPQLGNVRNVSWGRSSNELLAAVSVDGRWQINSLLLDSGDQQPLLTDGFSAKYAADGTLYFTRLYKKGIWRLKQGVEELFYDQYTPHFGSSWQLASEALWLLRPNDNAMGILKIDLHTGKREGRDIPMEKVSPRLLSVTDDGQISLALLGPANTDIVEVIN
ncbi:winged helix-turn-helix domain-containing protein [Shewanella algae]|uniref:winged helix-turn-helix domain-containing protein n=1 Tax=Shewanella algae TaxID=38313 RepID=UPI001C04797F|nr:winged helix-turn-helix domain-containing protein [Shewanella algae]QWL06870.1 winged helix-turn-helix domain-containing protein [Shewanella algae]